MAPKRLGPGGRLRNSGFSPKSSLCGSDCICFCSGKGTTEDDIPASSRRCTRSLRPREWALCMVPHLGAGPGRIQCRNAVRTRRPRGQERVHLGGVRSAGAAARSAWFSQQKGRTGACPAATPSRGNYIASVQAGRLSGSLLCCKGPFQNVLK